MVLASPTRIDAGQTEICTAVKSRRLLNPPAAMAGEAAKDATVGAIIGKVVLAEHWPEIEMYVSAPGIGLTAMWQPELGD